MKNNHKAQQEMVGFVLIVILVIVGVMVFLILSLKSPEEQSSSNVDNMLGAIMKITTECAIVFEPQFEDLHDLFESCYAGKKCANLNIDTCEYLNKTLQNVFADIIKTESTIESYQFDFLIKEGDSLLEIKEGNCSGEFSSAQRNLGNSANLVVRLKICKSD
ncbi:MAG: hypothetical protein WC548_02975 [Candidatus Pacearchaeota archaeon]